MPIHKLGLRYIMTLKQHNKDKMIIFILLHFVLRAYRLNEY